MVKIPLNLAPTSARDEVAQWPGSGAAVVWAEMMKQCEGFWKKLPRRARNCGLLAYHYSEIGTDDLKQIVQSAARHSIGTAIALGLFERYISGRK